MSISDKYALPKTRDISASREHYKTVIERTRAKAARDRIAARQRAKYDIKQQATIEKIPLRH